MTDNPNALVATDNNSTDNTIELRQKCELEIDLCLERINNFEKGNYIALKRYLKSVPAYTPALYGFVFAVNELSDSYFSGLFQNKKHGELQARLLEYDRILAEMKKAYPNSPFFSNIKCYEKFYQLLLSVNLLDLQDIYPQGDKGDKKTFMKNLFNMFDEK